MTPALKIRIAKALEHRQRIATRGETVNQTTLAAAAKVKQASVSNWFSGKTLSLKAATADLAAAYLKVNPGYLSGTSAIMVLPTDGAAPDPEPPKPPPSWPFEELTPECWGGLSDGKRREIETYALGVVVRRDSKTRVSAESSVSAGRGQARNAG